ncbi:MAG TPA: MMPL family transporter [Solirubrobacteraceae bacterium]|jgi:RND superfamily putative drug exporter|nr:MMPL family transporter [Solirubrobacteraceae bacterium]
MNPKTPKSIAARAGAWSARNRKKAIAGWLAFVLVALFAGSSVGQRALTDDEQNTGDSARAERILTEAFPEGPNEQVLVQARGAGRFGDPAFTAALRDVERTLARAHGIENVEQPLPSKDRRSAVVEFEITTDDDDRAQEVVAPIEAAIARVNARHPDMRVEQFGGASAGRALDQAFEDDFQKAELFSIPLTLVILLLAFGALVAATLPVLLALSSVASAIGLTALFSQVMPVDDNIASVILLIGMAVGVDYALFYLRREREEREAGRTPLEAIDAAAATSGRAVLVSGLTVLVAMAGMFFTGHKTFTSFAVGTMLVVAVAMIGSLTVLPAMLSWLGPRVERGRIPFLRRGRGGESRVWGVILDRVLGHPRAAAIGATAVLLALAFPALGLKTANSGIEDLPRDIPIMQTYDRLQAAFPGGQIPAVVAIRASDVTAPAVRGAIAELRDAAVASRQFSPPTSVTVSDDRTVASVQLPIVGTGTDDRSNAALERLRDAIVPATVGRVAEVHVTGQTAGSKDFNDLMKSRAPLVFGFVLSLAFVLLLTTFRSIVIAAKAIVLNLLSVAAAYGLLVLVFQHGWGAGLLGVDEAGQGAITSWLPMFLFVILFGLSMDYHVFILSRIREAFDRGMSTDEAVAHGIRSTASVVTSAAAVMVAVFSIFGTLTFVDMKQMGVGLAAAILIDATIVRAVLLPAAMKLLGDWNWYLPRWMGRLPQPARATA